MAYGSNDPAESRRIVRQSLLSTVGRLYNSSPPTPEEAIAIARIWEDYVYEVAPGLNGAVTAGNVPAYVCVECGKPLTSVTFKGGNVWPAELLASNGMSKHGKVLCKTHYFEKKAV